MTNARDTVRDFYDKLSKGDAPGALGLMASDIEWTTMWHPASLPGPPRRRIAGHRARLDQIGDEQVVPPG